MSSDLILYETPSPGVSRIVLNRPETRNAQSVRLLYELNDAFDRAAQDDDIKVIVLAANGPHFSSGHDLNDTQAADTFEERDPVGTWCGFGCPGAAGLMAAEKELYVGFCDRWRNLPKPTIAQVHGKVIAGGLMLVWPCDIIVASDDAEFSDPTVAMGVAGIELLAHPFEIGVRKAKEMLFTGQTLTAQEAHRLGMVNHVVQRSDLDSFCLDMADRIASMPLFALRLVKESINAAQDHQGRATALQVAFAHHQLCHSHNQQMFGSTVDPSYFDRA